MKDVNYKTILVTTDGSDFASAAFPHALLFAKNFNSKILLFSVSGTAGQSMAVVEPTDLTVPVSVSAATVVELSEFNKKVAREYIGKIKQDFESAGARSVESVVGEGVPEKEIVAFAKEQKVDLIIVSTHGRSGLGRTFLGSVTDYVVRHASCPVLVVRPQERRK